MSLICELEVLNRLNGSLVVATRVLKAKASQTVPFHTIRQLEDALSAERNEMIKILDPIPEEVQFKLKGESKEEDQPGESSEEEPAEKPAEQSVEKPTRDEILNMTLKQIKAHVADNNLDVKISSSTTAAKAKELLLEYYGYELEAAEEPVEEPVEPTEPPIENGEVVIDEAAENQENVE